MRRPRALAVLSIRVEPRAPASAFPGALPELRRDLERRIRACLHPTDTLAALGDLHYVVLLERSEPGSFARHAADSIVQALDDRRGELVASVGISVHPDDGADVDELIRCADTASEAAELGGGNLFGFYSKPMDQLAQRSARIERALVGAVGRGEFHLCYQPQIDTRDGSLVAAEALLRYTSGALGAVGPDEFIPVLEATGGIEEVGAWVLGHACEQAAAWMRAGRPTRVCVNVSARQLAGAELEAKVAESLERTALPASLLELELTESVLVDDPAETRGRIERLRARGVRVTLDDFGTGFASLSYIRQLPIDGLKIDRQFVRGLPVDVEAVAITSAIVALARSLRLEIVAEGIEHEAEEEFLHSLDCFVVQGFLHARPMRAEAFEAWRSKRPWA